MRAKTIARIVPEKEAELLLAIGEEKLVSLIETRKKYLELLDEWDNASVKGRLIKALYDKHKNVKGGEKGGGNATSLIQRELATKVSRSTIYLELPYEKIKEKLTLGGYIENNKPCSRKALIHQSDVDIIQHFTYLAQGLLNFYKCADNK